MHLNRRNFLRKTAAASAGIGLAAVIPSGVWAARVAPSDRINIAVIGCRNFGFKILRDHLDYEDTRCVAMCDVDEGVLNERAETIRKEYNQKPRLYGDFRKMLEQSDIDAVIIGTPDHWHCLHMIYCLQAGKDVYIEKPLANTIGECNIMVSAADRYNKIVQVGQQQRSNRAFRESIGLVRNGSLGKLRKVKVWGNFNYGLGTPFRDDEPVPEGVDYNMWLGPAPERPFNRSRFHGSWRHYWDYGGGLMSDWGVHLIDMGLWVNDLIDAPEEVMTFATNNSGQQRQRETFDTMTVVYPKKDYVISWEMTAGIQSGPWGKSYGVAFICDNGTVITDRHGYRVIPEWDGGTQSHKANATEISGIREAHPYHVRNFLDCIKSRETPVCPPSTARAAAIHVHVPNIAARTGESLLVWDDVNSRFTNSKKANELVTPAYRAPWKLPQIT
ncbi:MAG: twin-arginine translocation signal domain-containing protein [Marinilabiliales bacterium]|nr:MAG: twin-arginine translocation signal domain-containing protein [Marinilabiliales bacterium]